MNVTSTTHRYYLTRSVMGFDDPEYKSHCMTLKIAKSLQVALSDAKTAYNINERTTRAAIAWADLDHV